MQIFLMTLSGETLPLEVDACDTIVLKANEAVDIVKDCKLHLSVATLGGQTVANVDAKPTWQLKELLDALPEDDAEDIPRKRRLLLGETELREGSFIADLGVSDGAHLTLVYSPRSCVLSAKDETAQLWCVETGAHLWSFEIGERVDGVAVSLDGMTMLTHGPASTRLWSMITGQCLHTLQDNHEGIFPITFAEFGADSQEVLTSFLRGVVRLWSVVSGACLFTVENAKHAFFLPHGRELLTTHRGGHVLRQWSKASGQCLWTFDLHRYNCYQNISFSPNGLELLAVARDTTTGEETGKVLSTVTGECLLTLAGHEDMVYATAYSPDGHHMVTADALGVVKLWSSLGQCLWTNRAAHEGIYQTTFFPDGRLLIATVNSNTVIWSPVQGEHLKTLWAGGDRVGEMAVRLSETGEYAMAQDGGGTFWIWNAVTGQCLWNFFSRGWFGRAAFCH